MTPTGVLESARPACAVFVTGPTAAGKTEAVLELARRLPVDIISADAAQVYRGMDIGTAKPDPETLARFPHRLVDIRDPEEAYSAAEFRRDALAAVETAMLQQRIPLITGGTMFYVSALINGLSDLPESSSRFREAVTARAERHGWDALYRELRRVDPELAGRIGPADRQRLLRAHEILLMCGRAPSVVMAESRPRRFPHPFVHIALFQPRRSVLHRRIERRFADMLERGFLAEVEKLKSNPRLRADSLSMRTVGYRQAWRYLDGAGDADTFAASVLAATRQLAKRQLTWLRGTPGTVWMDASDPRLVDTLFGYLEARLKPVIRG